MFLDSRRNQIKKNQNEGNYFKNHLISIFSSNHLERFFGPGARNGLKQMGGINKVAIALSGKSVYISYKKVFLI